MTEQESSGGSAPVAANAAPAHTAGTTAAFQASDASATSAFGATRGSGLARGKRNAQRPAQSESTPSLDYKPTSIEVITPTREYSNPFASETPASAPVETPAPVAPVAVQVAPVIPAVAPAPIETIPEPVAVQAEPISREEPAAPAPAEKSEIKILPPEETKRTSVSWDSSSPAFPDEQPKSNGPRPVFSPKPRAGSENHRGDVMPPRNRNAERPYVGGPSDESAPAGETQAPRDEQRPRNDRPRRDDRPKFDGPREDRPKFDGPREDRPKFDGPRGDRRDGRRDGPREPRGDFRRDRPAETSAPVAIAPKAGGFIGWLKGLFGTKPETVVETPRQDGQNRQGGREGGRGPRRDGRGRGGEHRPHNHNRSGEGQGGGQHGQPQGDSEGRGGEGGQRRRRRGRGRGRGGYNGGDRSEGQQGGGAI